MFYLFQQGALLLQNLFLIGLQVGVFATKLNILCENLAILIGQHVDRRLQLREHVVIMLTAADKPGEHAADKAAGKGEH